MKHRQIIMCDSEQMLNVKFIKKLSQNYFVILVLYANTWIKGVEKSEITRIRLQRSYRFYTKYSV